MMSALITTSAVADDKGWDNGRVKWLNKPPREVRILLCVSGRKWGRLMWDELIIQRLVTLKDDTNRCIYNDYIQKTAQFCPTCQLFSRHVLGMLFWSFNDGGILDR